MSRMSTAQLLGLACVPQRLTRDESLLVYTKLGAEYMPCTHCQYVRRRKGSTRRDGVGPGAALLARVLQFMETPQYLRK